MANEHASWSFRVMRHLRGPSESAQRTGRAGPEQHAWYAIHEVYYNDRNGVESWEDTPADVYGWSPEELRWTLQRMTAALDEEVLDFEGGSELGLLRTRGYFVNLGHYETYPEFMPAAAERRGTSPRDPAPLETAPTATPELDWGDASLEELAARAEATGEQAALAVAPLSPDLAEIVERAASEPRRWLDWTTTTSPMADTPADAPAADESDEPAAEEREPAEAMDEPADDTPPPAEEPADDTSRAGADTDASEPTRRPSGPAWREPGAPVRDWLSDIKRG